MACLSPAALSALPWKIMLDPSHVLPKIKPVFKEPPNIWMNIFLHFWRCFFQQREDLADKRVLFDLFTPLWWRPCSFVPEVPTDNLQSHLSLIGSFFPTSWGHLVLSPHSLEETTRGRKREIKKTLRRVKEASKVTVSLVGQASSTGEAGGMNSGVFLLWVCYS